ncbi:hypothetical protein CFIMG_003340RAa [Ceratocystis fimbriata CBS 114723]|uniref:Uncharacterized protein n=1 Tax=Ceratocystis fimbriata CBS 114723 TaxID=1035309 RepID=A0A2C5X8H9_9PEZI|nr:hypothetical protein CFIMG_003340RAa [Ceratocystis fimbriata CBS 114723]
MPPMKNPDFNVKSSPDPFLPLVPLPRKGQTDPATQKRAHFVYSAKLNGSRYLKLGGVAR